MKKYIIYIGVLAIGLISGWFLFGGSTNSELEHSHDEILEAGQMWTCSMHPQIMQPESGDCPICGMDLIPAEVGAEGLAADQFKLTENAMALANIQTSIIGTSQGEGNAIKLSGIIVENEETNAVQVSYFSGRIEQLNVSFTGEEVQKGQLLATVYSPELYAAQQELLTAASLRETQPELYNAVRNKLKLWKLSETQITQIEETGKIKENFPVYATVSGTVSEKLVEQGESIKQGQSLLKIANLNTVWANFDLYEHQIDLFKKDQEVLITTNTFPNREFKAKVDFINPVLDPKTRTVKLRAVLNNKTNQFKPGMFVEGEMEGIVSDNENVIIPSSAILWTGKRSVAYIKMSPNEAVFEMREIELGNRINDSYEVLDGLNNGDEIVTNGAFTIDAAAQLQGKKSMMNKDSRMTKTGHENHLGNDEESESSSDQSNLNQRISVPTEFQNQLKVVFNNYINLKDALVKDDSKKVKEDAMAMSVSLAKVDMKLLTDSNAHNQWMSIEKKLKSSSNSISSTAKIKEQRKHFKQLSLHLTSAVQLFGINEKVYNQFCPMADNDKGAYWLSREEQVFNPYFGDAMLKCGSVKQIFDK